MIKVSQVTVMNFDNAIRGARNPLNSWERMDSYYDDNHNFVMGENDLNLAKKLCKAGSDHRKFVRQIFVSMDICAPMYWWKEFDTYKVGTTANSTSTMHKIHSAPFSIMDFSHDKLDKLSVEALQSFIDYLEELRVKFNETKDKNYWYAIIQLLPSSYNQTRTVTMSYENLVNMYFARRTHKLDEWRVFCEDTIAKLPYFIDFFGE